MGGNSIDTREEQSLKHESPIDVREEEGSNVQDDSMEQF